MCDITLLRPAFYYTLLTLVVLAVIYFLSIRPPLSESEKISQDISLLRTQIKEQQMLAPVFARLVRSLDQDVTVPKKSPEPEFFPRAQNMEGVIDVLRHAVLLSGLQAEEFSPDLFSMQQGNETFLVECDLLGEHADFRQFMLNLVAGPNFKRLESMEIEQTLQGTRYRLRIFMSLS